MSKFKPSPEIAAGPGEVNSESRLRRPRTKPSALHTAIISSTSGLAVNPPPIASTTIAEPANPAKQLALKVTLLFLYFRFSYVHEFISSMIHVDTHILIILGTICYLAWFVSGGIFAAYEDKLAYIWTGIVACMFFATVFSTWRGGSIPIFSAYVRTIFPLLLLIPAVAYSVDDLKKIVNVIGIAGTTTVLFGLVHRDYLAGRMDIATDGSSIQDPNDFAANLVMILPAIAYYMFAKQRPVFVKVFGGMVVAAALLEMMSTGSRGAFIAFLVMLAYIVVTGTPRVRLALLVGGPLLAGLALPFVPQASVLRLKSLIVSSDESASASESSDARRALLMASLEVTAHHPILGVGPGQFASYQAGEAAENHQKGMWHETHNGYTQLSSECGMPAALLYLYAVFLTFRSLKRARQVNVPDLQVLAKTLATMAVGFSASLIFLAQGYKFTMLVIGAIVIAMNHIVGRYQASGQSLEPA